MKRADTNQIFQMLMTLIVVGMILLLGFQLIGNVFQRSSQIDYIKFRGVLVGTLDSISSDLNARQRVSLDVPRGTEKLCFVDIEGTVGSAGNPLIDAYWGDPNYRNQDDKEMIRNVFLIGNDFFASFRVQRLSMPSDRFKCINVVRNKVDFVAVSQSRRLSILNLDEA